MIEPGVPRSRAGVDGKFFRRGAAKFPVKGVAYGPFAPNAQGEPFASPVQTARDFEQVRELGANLLRVYHVPPPWFLDLAAQHDLLLLIDVPWDKRICVLDSPQHRATVRDAVRHAVYSCARHPAVFAFSVANEIPPDIVRWSGARAVEDFIDELVREAKQVDPDGLCTFTNYPPTEFLRPQALDFVCFNVYLHPPQAFKNYLSRLQMMTDAKPLVLGEIGVDSLREGESRKCDLLSGQIESVFRGGLAGAVVFTFTDDWHKDGRPVEDWAMGLTTADRRPKDSFRAVQRMFRAAPALPLPRVPKVSVVVASYNADRTLPACLDSLRRLNYPDYEVILVDDGSTDSTPELAANFGRDEAPGKPLRENPADAHDLKERPARPVLSGPPRGKYRCLRHPENLGLSAARNTGLAAAEGEIIAFTDADCRADEDWLYHLVGALLDSEFAGVGGPNLLPPEDGAVAAAVMASPGGPAHVMFDDRHAEHIPGCNMAFYRRALDLVGGFDPVFRTAGDDVDLCWRLQEAGCKIGFSPAASVWHYRRSTVGAYLQQQRGYGEAEALLVRKHPGHFNALGGSVWHGRIYTPSRFGVRFRAPIIYHGTFGTGLFQTLYASAPAFTPTVLTTLEYHVLVTLPLWVLSAAFHPLLPVAITSLLLSVAVCAVAGAQASLPRGKRRWWSRPLVALLHFLQPIARGRARYSARLHALPRPSRDSLESAGLCAGGESLGEVRYWTDRHTDRVEFVRDLIAELARQNWPSRADIGWSEFDAEICGNRWSSVQLSTVSEDHPRGRQLIRCRLRARWSLEARTAFWSLAGLELLAFQVLPDRRYGAGLLLLTLPLFAWFLSRQKRRLQSLVTVFLDALARKWRFVKEPATARAEPGVRTVLIPAVAHATHRAEKTGQPGSAAG